MQKVINHQAYDQKADIFSFAIVLWELTTAKVRPEVVLVSIYKSIVKVVLGCTAKQMKFLSWAAREILDRVLIMKPIVLFFQIKIGYVLGRT